MKGPNFYIKKSTVFIAFIIVSISLITSGFKKNEIENNSLKPGPMAKDNIESVKAFMQVYKVLKSPGCMNCHPAGDRPLQGDDSHVHSMNVQRGKDGKGLYALKCSNCHQPENAAAFHAPPGNPKWQLPPSNMKMVFEGKTARQLAIQIMDYN